MGNTLSSLCPCIPFSMSNRTKLYRYRVRETGDFFLQFSQSWGGTHTKLACLSFYSASNVTCLYPLDAQYARRSQAYLGCSQNVCNFSKSPFSKNSPVCLWPEQKVQTCTGPISTDDQLLIGYISILYRQVGTSWQGRVGWFCKKK